MLSCAPNTYTSIHKLAWCGSIFYNLEGMKSTTIRPSTRGMSCLSCHALWSSLEWTVSASLRFENSAKIPWLKPLARAGAKFGPALTCTTPLNLAPKNHKRYEHGKINACKDSKKICVWHMWKKLCAEIQEDMSMAYLKSVAAIQEDYYSGIWKKSVQRFKNTHSMHHQLMLWRNF